MGSRALTTASTLQCPHQGRVAVACSNDKTRSGGYILRASDAFTIAGCVLTTPAGNPIPCVTVRWLSSDTRVKVTGAATLSEGSIGQCLNAAQVPQGVVALIDNAQSRTETV